MKFLMTPIVGMLVPGGHESGIRVFSFTDNARADAMAPAVHRAPEQRCKRAASEEERVDHSIIAECVDGAADRRSIFPDWRHTVVNSAQAACLILLCDKPGCVWCFDSHQLLSWRTCSYIA